MKLDSNGQRWAVARLQKIISGLGASFDPYQRSTNSRRSAGQPKAFLCDDPRASGLIVIAGTFRSLQRKQARASLLAFISKPN